MMEKEIDNMVKESYIQHAFSDRIGGDQFGKQTVIYKFEKIKRAKREALRMYPNRRIIDLGVGEPDEMADCSVVETLAREAARWENRTYADNGISLFQEAAVEYMDRVYDVKGLNPGTEVMHAIGSKSALALLPMAFINQGDFILSTVPGYPICGTMTQWLGGEVYPLPLIMENGFLPDLDSIPESILRRAKLLYINYPNNPTGACATLNFYRKVVDFAKRNGIIVVQDAAYAALTFDGEKPLSFLSVEGAKEVGVEVHSLSKAFNMTGWRIAFLAGNELVIKAYGCVKENFDSGQFRAIQLAGVYALNNPQLTDRLCEKYSRRHDMLINILTGVGFQVVKPKASFYLYVAAPKGIRGGKRFVSAEDFSQYLILQKQISTVPWDDAGSYIRLSVTFLAESLEEEIAVMKELEERLREDEFIF